MSTRLSTLIIILILMHIVLSGCAPDHGEPDSPKVNSAALKPGPAPAMGIDIPKATVEGPPGATNSDWLPELVSLTCSLQSCLPQVGVVIFVMPTVGTKFEFRRCTAFLIDHDKIMTNGHCDYLDTNEGYFVTRTDMPGKTYRKVTKRLFKDYTPNLKNPEVSSVRPDVAVFQLESPITTIEPLHLATGAPKSYASLTALVVNPAAGNDKQIGLTVGQLNCTVHRHERFFPFELIEAPDVLNVFDCESIKGNSGAPMFAPGSADVEAILFGGKDLPDYIKTLREKEHRAPYTFETHQIVSATNLRCVNYPSAAKISCLKLTDDEMQKRYSSTVDGVVKDFERRTLETSTPAGALYKDFSLEIKNGKSVQGGEFEIMYLPACRNNATVSSFEVPSEHVRLDLDAWAKPAVTRLGLVTSSGTVTAQSATNVTVNMNWVPAFGTFVHPDKDLRTQLGKSFSVALPACPR